MASFQPSGTGSCLSENPDIFAHLIMPKLYTPICFCFSSENLDARSQIIETLTKGLERLSASFPWLAGQVISKDLPGNSSRLAEIVPLKSSCMLIVSDITNNGSIPSMENLKRAKFPFSMLDGTLLSPLIGAPTSQDGDPVPVFFVQATFINGGLILTIAGEHSIMDGQGLGQVIRLFSKACYNEPFTNEELSQQNPPTNNLIPLLTLETYKAGPELDNLIKKPTSAASAIQGHPLSTAEWAYFRFSFSNLSSLKSKGVSSFSASTKPEVNYITTNDVLSAFIWQSISRVRSFRLPHQTVSTFARAVDVRPCLNIPSSYLGNMSNHTYNTLPLSVISSSALGLLSSMLRTALQPEVLKYGIRSLATHMSLTSDKSSISYGANMDLSHDIFFSSWAKLPCYGLDFNLGLGLPESVRRARYAPIEGLMYLMPMGRAGEIDAAICLSLEDLERLKMDQEFSTYAEWIG